MARIETVVALDQTARFFRTAGCLGHFLLNGIGDVFHLMKQVDKATLGIEDGSVHRLPEFSHEEAAGVPDIVPLDTHGIGNAILGGMFKRCIEIADPVCLFVRRVVGEDIEHATPCNLGGRCQSGIFVRGVNVDDVQSLAGVQQEVGL